MNLILLKQFLLLENFWIHISFFYIRHRSTIVSTEYPSFQITFPQQETSSIRTYRKTINPINLQIPIQEVFHAFLNKVKGFNLTVENPKYSPNALEEREQNIHNFEVEDIERLIVTHKNPHHWLQTDSPNTQFSISLFQKTLNEQTISQTKLLSLFLRNYFRFNYQLLWSQQDKPAFAAFHNHFTADECLPFIINEHNEHPYFVKLDTIAKQAIDYISFNPRLITANNLHDDNRPNRYEQNFQEQLDIFPINSYDEDDTKNEEFTPENQNEDDTNNEENIPENQNENRNEDMTLNTNENNASEYTTPESITSAQNTSQIETSPNTQFVRIPTRIVSPRQNTNDPQSYSETLPHRNITFTFPPSPEESIQDRTQNITSSRDISVNVISPTRTISNNTRNTTRPIYYPPSVPSVFKYSNKTSQPENHYNNNNNPPTSSQFYDPFNYSFFPPFNTNIQTNNTQNVSQSNNNINSTIQHPRTHLLQTKFSQSKFPPQNQRISYSNIVQPSHRRSQNPPLSHISTDPLY